MTWLVDNIGAALVGMVVAGVIASMIAYSRENRSSRKRDRYMERDGGPMQEKTLRLLRSSEHARELYEPTAFELAEPLPIMTHPSMLFELDIRQGNRLMDLQSTDIDELPEDPAAIDRRQAMGTELWNGDLTYLERADLAKVPPRLELRRSSFFAYVSAVEGVETALRSRRPERKRALADYRSINDILSSDNTRLWLSGAAVTLLHGTARKPRVIIHRRSRSVVNAPGIRTVAPVFGIDAATIGDNRSDLGIALYNVAREYAEELFDKESVVMANRDTWHHPDQALATIDEIRTLIDDLDAGTVRISLTGMCVNPRDCGLSLAYLIEIGEDSDSAKLLRGMRGGWEAEAGRPGEPAVEVLDLFDARLDAWANQRLLYPTSVFALDRARTLVRHRQQAP